MWCRSPCRVGKDELRERAGESCCGTNALFNLVGVASGNMHPSATMPSLHRGRPFAVLPRRNQTTVPVPKSNKMAELARDSRSMGAALALSVGVVLTPSPALALGPETVPLVRRLPCTLSTEPTEGFYVEPPSGG
jgi:hypothetical protein